MKLPFRHGIVKYTLDNNKVPTFLYTDRRDNHVSLIANYDKVLFTVAYTDTDYLYEEKNTTNNAWGPFDHNTTYWMYWDLNMRTGKRTFGHTVLAPVTSYVAPETTENDQHWFDLTTNCMRFYEDGKWIKCLRVFAGTYHNGAIVASPLSSQVGLFKPCEAGFIMYSDNDSPAVQASDDGTYKFLTTTRHFDDTESVSTTVSLQAAIFNGVADTDLQKFSIITYNNDKIKKASYDDENLSLAVGIVLHDIPAGNKGTFETNAYATNPDWNWTVPPSSAIYLGLNGQIQTTPPPSGFIQKIGFVVSKDTVYIDTTYQIIYHNSFSKKIPIPVSIDKKTGKLYTSYAISDEMVIAVHYNTYHNVYQQPVENQSWLLKHSGSISNFLVQTYDERGHMIYPNNISRVDDSTVSVEFSKKTTGHAKLFLY